MNKNHLLIVDDDEKLRHLLDQYLTRSGFTVTGAENPHKAEELLKLFSFDVIIMDVMMPFQNGLDYTRSLRKKGIQTPILMLTAMGDVSSRIVGLEAGADDYLAKPFDPKELVLRLKNLLKHQPVVSETISFGPFIYDTKIGLLTKNNQQISLTTAEKNLMNVLTQFVNRPVSREELARQTQTDSLRTIDVQITRLRHKIEENLKHPLWIQTVRGEGYKLVI